MKYNPNSYYQQRLIQAYGMKKARQMIEEIGNFQFGSKIINKKITKRLRGQRQNYVQMSNE